MRDRPVERPEVVRRDDRGGRPAAHLGALVGAMKIAALPVVRLDVQDRADVFERVREFLVTNGSMVKTVEVAIDALLEVTGSRKPGDFASKKRFSVIYFRKN